MAHFISDLHTRISKLAVRAILSHWHSVAVQTDSPACAGQAKLLEHNVRFGDPECQCLMLRLQSDLLEVLMAACSGRLADVSMQWASQVALTVIMAAKGYPGKYSTGTPIHGLEQVTSAKVCGLASEVVEPP